MLGERAVVVAPGPVPLSSALLREPAVDAPKQCHARNHVDLPGDVVKWGESHRVDSAAACCAACRADESKPSRCNVWVWCGDERLCGAKFRQCWLKYLKPSLALGLLQHGGPKEVPWVSGFSLDKPVEAIIDEATELRAAGLRAPLTMLNTRSLAVGLRNETGTVEFLAPAEHPAFSFVLPLEDEGVATGPKDHLDRMRDFYHHLGDVNLRLRGEGGGRGDALTVCSTVFDGTLVRGRDGLGRATRLERGEAGAGGWLWRHSRELDLEAIDSPVQRKPTGKCPVAVTREIVAEPERLGGAVQLRFTVTNPKSAAGFVTVADLGVPLPFDHHFAGRTLVQVAHQCSFTEPFLGAGGGFVQVARASGGGPALLLLPLAGTEVENWRPLREEDKARQTLPLTPHAAHHFSLVNLPSTRADAARFHV